MDAAPPPAARGLGAIFKPGFNYAKAGVMLLDLQAGDVEQGELDLDPPARERAQLVGAIDALNDRYGPADGARVLNKS